MLFPLHAGFEPSLPRWIRAGWKGLSFTCLGKNVCMWLLLITGTKHFATLHVCWANRDDDNNNIEVLLGAIIHRHPWQARKEKSQKKLGR